MHRGIIKLILIISAVYLVKIIPQTLFIQSNNGRADNVFMFVMIGLSLTTLVLYFLTKERIKKSYELNNVICYLTFIITAAVLIYLSKHGINALDSYRFLDASGDRSISYQIMLILFAIEYTAILLLDLLRHIVVVLRRKS